MRKALTHLDPRGGIHMVDVGQKEPTSRVAIARGRVRMSPETVEAISAGPLPKGDVFTVAQVAGIMAAKRTADIVPLCHPLALTGIQVQVVPNRGDCVVEVEARISLFGKTGAEMEALTAVSAACLTVYDMCKAVDKEMVIDEIRLVKKSGGKSGEYAREDEGIGEDHCCLPE